MKSSLALALCLPLLAALMGCAIASAQPEARLFPLLDGLGDHHHPITTPVAEAQRYFDQGLILAFGFNYPGALRSFREAQRLDPGCAACFWGEALVLGPNINMPMNPDNNAIALAALQQAQALGAAATERERAYIRALTARYRPQAAAQDRAALDQAYAQAMGEVASQYPDDLDAQALYAEALLDTTPWDYWLPDGSARPVTENALNRLEAVLQRAPQHPLANHLYIHAVEAEHPERGRQAAERLLDLVPGAGHLVHMPSHIYIRTGDYHRATQTNLAAIEADRRYLAQVQALGEYRLAYVPHNYHFLWATATFEGRSELAIQSARKMAALVDTDAMRDPVLSTLQHYWITPLYALVRFGQWDEILDWPQPEEDLVYPRGVWHYARGMALARQGQPERARSEWAALQALVDDRRLEWVTVWDINKGRHILEIASHALAGEVAAAAGDPEAAVASLRRAVAREDALNYDEPPTWHFPMRQALGAALLQAGRPAAAAEAYRQDLQAFPDNGWSLFGLLEALRRQGEVAEANLVASRFRKAWQHADITLTASQF